MSGYVTKVRDLLVEHKQLTLPKIYLLSQTLERRQISSALTYLLKANEVERTKVDNAEDVGRRNVYQYTYIRQTLRKPRKPRAYKSNGAL